MEVCGRLIHKAKDDGPSGTNRGIREDHVETLVPRWFVERTEADLCMRHRVRLYVATRKIDGPRVDVRHEDAAVRRKDRRHDPQDAVAATEVEDVCVRGEPKGPGEQLRPSVDRAVREHPGVR